MKWLDQWLDHTTMYRLVVYYLLAVLAAAILLSTAGWLPYNPFAIAFSAGYLCLICWLANRLFGWVLAVPTNVESVYITALILALIITPYQTLPDIWWLGAAGGLAMASKFVLAVRRKHIFNPAAVAVVLTAWGGGQAASWWVGAPALLPVVIVGGMVLVKKIQRQSMVLCFAVAALVSMGGMSLLTHHNPLINIQQVLLHSGLFFFAFVMLTEPLTAPTIAVQQRYYGLIVGGLFAPQLHLGSVYSTPELVLLVGNIYAFAVGPRLNILPHLTTKLPLAPDIFDFVFKPPRRFTYLPGQYMEFTLAHDRPDSRGNRRYFTLASSPTEDNLRLGVKFYPHGSTYKRALAAMTSASRLAAGQLGGDFTLPSNAGQPLVFIAGGIGITPYRSMIKYLLDTNQTRRISLFYAESSPTNLIYRDVFDQAARQLGLKVFYVVSDPTTIPPDWSGQTGRVSAPMISRLVPEYQDCLFYISGSHSMVASLQSQLLKLGIDHRRIKTDYFPGYS